MALCTSLKSQTGLATAHRVVIVDWPDPIWSNMILLVSRFNSSDVHAASQSVLLAPGQYGRLESVTSVTSPILALTCVTWGLLSGEMVGTWARPNCQAPVPVHNMNRPGILHTHGMNYPGSYFKLERYMHPSMQSTLVLTIMHTYSLSLT